MDARTEVQDPTPTLPEGSPDRMSYGRESKAAGDQATTLAGKRATRTEPRLSVDPMRATDKYRLVMPYSGRV
ncbi:MAG TPA: hypothetical protein VFD82_13275 [Planctomycetota bacterium]|nr:hypothetical protein [Planctomycetota bacterium]